MLTLYGINVCYYFYILWSHFSKVILTTDHSHSQSHYKRATLKVITVTTQVFLVTEEVIIANLSIISATTKVILATNKLVSAIL